MLKIKRKNLAWISFILIVLLFGFFYFDMIFSLPLFGDATIQGRITKDMLNRGLLDAEMGYPPLYNILQGILFSLFGESGMNSIVFLGLLLIAVSIFLLVKEVTDRVPIALLSTIIVLASPKIIFYSGRMYMEVLVSGLLIFTIFLLIRFVKTRSTKNLILLTIFTAITACIKQQGLFILFPSILLSLCCFFVIEKRRGNEDKIQNRLTIKHILIYFFIFFLLISPAYLVVIRNSGEIMQGSEEFGIFRLVNQVGRQVSGYKEPVEDIGFEGKWGQRLEEIEERYYDIGATRAEIRHTWPLDPIISWEGFSKINGLYLEKFGGGSTSRELADCINFIMLFGLVLFVLNIMFKNKILKFKDSGLQFYFLIFLVIFLAINYTLFLRNTDQVRYHLFVSIIFSLFSAVGVYFLVDFLILQNKFSTYARIMSVSLILILLVTTLITLTYEDTTFNKRWGASQVYSSSKGGVASIQEAGEWLNNHTNDDDPIWQNCGNELSYYSGRKVIGSFEFYFLNESELGEIFKDQNVRYIVVFDAMIVPDEKWINFCWVPESFVEKIRKIYPRTYRTSFGDIGIYEV